MTTMQKHRSAMAAVPPVGPRTALTARELEVLRFVAEGRTSRSIAEALDLSERTVHHHLRSIFEKLGVRTRTAAAVAAVWRNILDPGVPTHAGHALNMGGDRNDDHRYSAF